MTTATVNRRDKLRQALTHSRDTDKDTVTGTDAQTNGQTDMDRERDADIYADTDTMLNRYNVIDTVG